MADLTKLTESAKTWLRISTDSLNEEIGQVIEACLIDLKNGGVVVVDADDKIIQQAIKLYLKAQFGYDQNAEKFSQAYEYLKASLALSGIYNEES